MIEIIKWYGIIITLIVELAHLIVGIKENSVKELFNFILVIPILIYFIIR